MYSKALISNIEPDRLIRSSRFKREFSKEHPYYFSPSGTLVFCGSQGEGKTLSAVTYVLNVLNDFPNAILCTNVSMLHRPFNAYMSCEGGKWVLKSLEDDSLITSESIVSGIHKAITVEYWGLDTLKFLENDEYGVLYFIDEIHLELNSLESKNVDVDIMTEISQQRKQRKHIVGTSQRYMRLAKPLREQIRDIVLCRCFFGLFQFNKLIDGENSYESNGKLKADVKKMYLFFHSPEQYKEYDTYAKMKRYKNSWQGFKPVNFSKGVVVSE